MNKDNNQLHDGVYRSGMVHTVISDSYMTFLIAIVLGVVFDFLIPIKIFNNYLFQYLGFIMIIIGPMLTYWAQRSSSIAKKNVLEKGFPVSFEYGPYKYTRNPSYLGVFIMIIGLGIILNSIFSIIFGFVAYLIIRFIFLKKEEKLLEDKYGQIYIDYKNKIKNRL